MTLLSPLLLNIDSIIPSPEWSLHQDVSMEPAQGLIESIAHLGILRPPIVKAHRNGYELICGFRRLRALRKLDYSSPIFCLVVKNDVKWEDLLLLVGEDQIHSGPLSGIEAARFISLYEKWCKQPEYHLIDRVTSARSITQRSRLLSLLELEKPIRTSIHHGHISDKTGFFMTKLPQTERKFVHELFIRLSLNANKQRRFVELVEIIIGTSGCTIEQVITEYFSELCSGPIDNIPQQTNLLMKRLYQLSHPESSEAKIAFNKLITELNLPAHCMVSPSNYFETDKVTLEVEFPNIAAFSEAWVKIKNDL